jgi:AraC-like DNA-binding protein
MVYAQLAMNLLRSSRSDIDPLSAVLATLGARSEGRTRLEAAGEWALAFPEKERLKLVAVMRGTCWMLLPDLPARRLGPGDVFMIGRSRYTIADSPTTQAMDGAGLYANADTSLVTLGGDETVLMGASISFESADAGFLIDALPAFLQIERSSRSAVAVSRTLDLLDAELGRRRVGGSLVSTRLAEILFIEAIRAYVDKQGETAIGWIGALADHNLAEALSLIHGECAYPWTVASLAGRVGMSRSAFSARFTQRVGKAPLEYLTHWRMLTAREMLKRPGADTARIALQVGYRSQSAFGHAFKRAFGHAPRRGKAEPSG